MLNKEQLQLLVSLADRGLASVVSGLAQQQGQTKEIARISSLAAELFDAVQKEMEPEVKNDEQV